MERVEMAIWFNANDYILEDAVEAKRDEIEEYLKVKCRSMKAKAGEIKFEILKPGDERVPEVPKWLEITPKAVPRLLFAYTDAVPKKLVTTNEGGIAGDLEKKDLERLRTITRRQHQKSRPGEPRLTDPECDAIINQVGKDVVLEELRKSSVH